MEIKLELLPPEKRRKLDLEGDLPFGCIFTDHMFLMYYQEGKGWYDAQIKPYEPICLDPAATVFHYSQTIFEGLKAYYGVDGRIRLFRPERNMARMNYSAKRMCMPAIDKEFALHAIKTLVDLEKGWIPKEIGSALYIRPVLMGTEAFLGVKPSSEYIFFIILSPVGAYYKEGFNPIKIYVTDKYVRAVPGGVGDVKTGGNYAASLMASEEAAKLGYTQVLWLDAIERRYVEEVGTMNIFFYFEDELVTPALTGTILPGITRESVIQMAKDWGLKVNERRITIDEVIEGAETGRLKECFGTGTAAVISPVGYLAYKGKEYVINQGQTGPLAQRLFEELTGIQYGEKPDPYGWIQFVP
ncbi:branched-chain amino acid aminotransferase [Thermodesulfatator indicus DSM 15286]|uniref:Branched-chain-amino-acid aminotransferase n=1 Tax=Thermodesulfatator indicus (strain DSM 15286 / JCM 11887 / CIR29812) TaxID=667014 RepID=F8A9K9_THEID|nr:branched-chain amino acid aminotransferase [Thermodesulfatator indicus]AEH45235.1 branched-chain amino acid aminotransferase [Thermodesulfatator indicus DSM 15286]